MRSDISINKLSVMLTAVILMTGIAVQMAFALDGMSDFDGDGVYDSEDNCIYKWNPNQNDRDNDGIGNVCDSDNDNDGEPDSTDCAPYDENVHDGASERCGNQIDDNCNGEIDENCNTCMDSDGDGMSDSWEKYYGLDPFDPSDAAYDNDDDGLTNLVEFILGTDPNNPDTDGDGMPDGWEYDNGLNPRDPDDAMDDNDDDGLSNYQEYLYGTDPNNPDSDGDGINDGDEIANGTDPLDANDPPGGAPNGTIEDKIAPLPVTNLVAIAISPERIRLTWVLSVSDDVSAYNIYRSIDSVMDFSMPYDDVGNRTASYDDVGLSPDTTYYYVVRAVDNSSNEENNTHVVAATTLDVGESADPDGDGLPTNWENRYNQTDNLLDPHDNDSDDDGVLDGDEDPDNDGLTNYEEYVLGTDPNNPDTDGDGMPDGWEADNGLNPLDPNDGAKDNDGDGLTNEDEFNHGTDPNNPDSDGDGVNDGDEVANGTDPTKPGPDDKIIGGGSVGSISRTYAAGSEIIDLVVEDAPKLEIRTIDVPKKMVVGQKYNVNAVIKNTGNQDSVVSVNADILDASNHFERKINAGERYTYVFEVLPRERDVGLNTARFKVQSGSKIIEREVEFSVMLSSVTEEDEGKLNVTGLSVKVSDAHDSVTIGGCLGDELKIIKVYVDDKLREEIDTDVDYCFSDTISVELTEGEHTLRLKADGKEYEMKFDVEKKTAGANGETPTGFSFFNNLNFEKMYYLMLIVAIIIIFLGRGALRSAFGVSK